MSFCGLPPGFGAHVPHFGHQSTFGVVLTSGRSLCSTFPHKSVEPSMKLCFGQQFPHHTLPSANCRSPLELSPRNFFNSDVRTLIVISHSTWDTNSCHFNALSFPSAHTYGDNLHCTSCQKFCSTTAEMAGNTASLLTQCCEHVHFFWDHPCSYHLWGTCYIHLHLPWRYSIRYL